MCPSRSSTSGRARVPICLTTLPARPTTICFCDSVSTNRRPNDLLGQLFDFDRDGVRNLLTRELQRLLADELGDLQLHGEVGPLIRREVLRTFRKQFDELLAKRADAVACDRADRVQSAEVSQLGGALHLLGDVTRLQAVDLVQRDHDRHAEAEHALGDEAVAGADPLPGREHEQHTFDIFERLVDRALHVLGERIARALEPGQICEHELRVRRVRDPEDAVPRRLRLVGDDRDLAAAERIHERRLADVRTAGDGDEA